MAIVMIRCSNTNLPMTTGLFMDQPEFESTDIPEQDRRLNCPLCYGIHVWQKDEAYLVEEEEPLLGA
jgi:hypothetical protein